jgi:hypothetical protein
MLSKGIGLEILCSILDISIYHVLKDYERYSKDVYMRENVVNK